MSWIGMTDRNLKLFNAAGIGAGDKATRQEVQAKDAILPRGTLMIETGFTLEGDEQQDALSYSRNKEWLRELSIGLSGAGAMTLTTRQAHVCYEAEIGFPLPERETRLRLYYSWNAPERWGRLSVKHLSDGSFVTRRIQDPLPMPALDALTIMRNGRATAIGKDTAYVAISDEIEPVGLSAGFATGTPVETPSGAIPIERLRLGDHVVTAGSGSLPIRWITKRRVPALGGFGPVRLRAPYFGLSRDILVAPDHKIRVSSEDAEYMLGQDSVMLEAGRLLGSHAAETEATPHLVTYYQILLDRHECVLTDSIWSETLYVGQLARDPERLAASTLADMPPSAIPIHRQMARNRLSESEARSLASVLHR